jgi:putative pyruvate formate lyase activating enzyme
MNQYTPMPNMTSPLDRTVTRSEYSELVSYAEKIGVVNAFIQEGGTQSESFIPEFTV